jgi:beta-N-acetylhexosaminidase
MNPKPLNMPLGPVMTDVAGLSLNADDMAVLTHPLVGGIILFARNFADAAQVTALCEAIHAVRSPALLISVDHEGGRVQRFKDSEGFTRIPPMRLLGDLWDANIPAARGRAFELGQTMGIELAAVGVDFSFAPVLDLDWGDSGVIGDRAFHKNPYAAASLATAVMQGLRSAGMAAVGKHFPGHGFIKADTHTELATDTRSLAELQKADLIPFQELIAAGIAAIMPAHVQYPEIDSEAACYSAKWLQDILRQEMRFKGMIFSDDLGMVGAHTAGDIVARADAALKAGCDMVLSCNDRPASLDLLARWQPASQPMLQTRAASMRVKPD